jgi:hypothetical protein
MKGSGSQLWLRPFAKRWPSCDVDISLLLCCCSNMYATPTDVLMRVTRGHVTLRVVSPRRVAWGCRAQPYRGPRRPAGLLLRNRSMYVYCSTVG